LLTGRVSSVFLSRRNFGSTSQASTSPREGRSTNYKTLEVSAATHTLGMFAGVIAGTLLGSPFVTTVRVQ
jgi:hypothetical protein